MESFGEKLKSTREKLGYSLEQIARDTHIAKRYLIALEEEDFSIFPGETYLKGFLQNYSEYLGLNPEEMLLMYRNMKIQEQPIPLEELLEQKFNSKKLIKIFILVGLFLVVATIITLLIIFNPLAELVLTNTTSKQAVAELVFTGQKISASLQTGMLIKINTDSNSFNIKTVKIEEKKISLDTAEGLVSLIIGEEKFFDFNRDGIPEISIFLTEIFKDGAELKAQVTLQQPASMVSLSATSDLDLIERGIAQVISEKEKPEGFRLELSFEKDCYTIFFIDHNERSEKMYSKQEKIALKAEKTADLRFSNSQAVKILIEGQPVNINNNDFLLAIQVRWVKTAPALYKLAVFPVK